MRYIYSFLLILIAFTGNARQISLEEAQSIAAEFFNSSSKSSIFNIPKRIMPTSSIEESFSEKHPYYIFNDGENARFVIVSGDDRTKKILGYSDSGCFDIANTPPPLSELLEHYSRIYSQLTEEIPQDSSWAQSPGHSEGRMLLETVNWGQGYPYNGQCPIIDGEQVPAGCVATAMAIVMKYHNWPEQGFGKGSYYGGFESTEAPINTDFYNYFFDYSILGDENHHLFAYEVSNLIYACGRAVNMIYHPSGSGAKTSVIGFEMAKHFNFSKDFKYLTSSDYTNEEWVNIIKGEIDNNRPVIYSLPSQRHAVVCDGYDGNLIHMNWGWDGVDNGYYNLSAFNEIPCNMTISLKPIEVNDEVGEIFIDSGLTSPGVNPYSKGIKTNVNKIESNIPFDIFVETLNLDSELSSDSSFAIALMDQNNTLKEIISEINTPFGTKAGCSKASYNYFSWNGHLGFSCQIFDNIIKSTLKEEDRLQLLTHDSNGNWIPMVGIDCHSYALVNDVPTEYSNVILDTNMTEDDLAGYIQSFPNGGFKGMTVELVLNKKRDLSGRTKLHYITLDGRIVHVDRKNSFYTSIRFSNDTHYLNIKSVDRNSLISCILETTKGGEVQRLIDTNYPELDLINSLTINGYVNSEDLYWIYSSLPALEYLDLTNSELTENYHVDNINPSAPFLNSGQLGNLLTLKMPKNSEYIYDSTFAYFEPLQNLFIPSGLKSIGIGAFQGANSLKNIILVSEIPCDLDPLAFSNEEYYYDTINILVPLGSKEAYRNHPEWGKFKKISEGDSPIIIANDIHINPETISAAVGDSFILEASIWPENVENKSVIWGSTDEEVARVDECGNVLIVGDGVCTITASTIDGSELTAECIITARPTEVISIFNEADNILDIYDINGRLITRCCSKDTLKSLDSGIYIVKIQGKHYKVCLNGK